MNEANRTTMAAVLEMWNGAPTAGLAALLAPAYRGHVLGIANGERDGAAYPGSIARYREAFPDVVFNVVEQFDAEDRLVTRLEARQRGRAGGPSSVNHGMNVARFDAGGRLIEEWAVWSGWQDSNEEADR